MAGGYQFEALNETPKEYECKICCQFLKDAVELSCSHAFCGDCLTRWENTKVAPTCPVCRKKYKRTDKQQSRVLNRIITTSLDVKCPLNKEGCDWTGTISDFVHHLCQYKNVQCSLEGCTEIMQLRLEKAHLQVCEHRVIACLYCSTKHKYKDQRLHLEECSDVVVKCPNQQCIIKIRRKNIAYHKYNCLYQEVDCPFKSKEKFNYHQCLNKIFRKDLEKHEREFVHLHCNELRYASGRKIRSLEADTNLMKLQMLTKNNEIKELKNEVKNLKQSLEDIRTLLEPEAKRRKKT